MKRRLLLATAILGWTARCVTGSPVHSFDLEKATTQADLIVVGRALNATEVENTTLELAGGAIVTATRYRATLNIHHVIKGDFNFPDLLLEFLIPESPVGLKGVDSGQYGIFFLKKDQNRWTFFDATNPWLPAVPGSETPTGAPLDRVTSLLVQVLESSGSTETEYFQALTALGRLRTDLSRELLRQALARSSGRSRLYIARTLVAKDDVAGLPVVSQALLEPDGLPGNIVEGLANSLRGLKDPNAVPSLSKLTASSNGRIRLGAVVALRQSGSATAIPALARLLNDPDKEVLYYAVVGLGEITHQDEWTPAMQEFSQHEKRYLDYWRRWAQAHFD